MNITRLNYSQTLPLIKQIISQSNFISLDLQMSGISSDIQSAPNLTDDLKQRYTKTKKRIQTFIPLQIGLCFHKIQPLENKIIFYPFNFYIYPLSIKQSDSIKFSFHASSLNFLAKNQFDFNKLFYQHVPFISNHQLKMVEQRKQQTQLMKQLMRLDALNSPSTKAFLNINLPKVQQWISSFSKIDSKNDSEIIISVKNMKYKAYQLFIDEIQRKYPSIQFDFIFDSDQIYKRSELKIKKKQVIQRREQNLRQSSLFSFQQENKLQLPLINQVMNCIVSHKLPLIVHNGLLDLMHIQNRFFQPLPNQWQQFTFNLQKSFPKIYDTKYICNNYPNILKTLQRQTSLQNCYTKLKADYQQKNKKQNEKQNLYKIEIHENFKQYNLQNQSSHQAGFDALMTGYIFFRSMNMLKKPLQSLVNPQFHTNPSLMRNRIPLGNIRTPLNLQQKQDYYSLHSNRRFQFNMILNRKVMTQIQICDFLKLKFGAVNFYWKGQDKRSFIITFIDKQTQQKFINKQLDKQDMVGFVNILNQKYIVKENAFINQNLQKQ